MGAQFYAAWPLWVRILVFIPPIFSFSALVVGSGVWPGKNPRAWRNFGILVAGFTVFCVVMFCGFHRLHLFAVS